VLRAEGAKGRFIFWAVRLSLDSLCRTVVVSKSTFVRLTLSKWIVALALTVSGIESCTDCAIFINEWTLALASVGVQEWSCRIGTRTYQAGTAAVLWAEGAEGRFIFWAVRLSLDSLSRTIVVSKSAVVRLTLSKRIVALALTVSGIESCANCAIFIN
jgi:hypothetical protein